MNSRYNIGKIIYKVDAFVDQSQKTIITDDISTKTIFVDSYFSLGKDSDLKNIIMKQDIDEETWETKDAILYAPYINIGKELKYDGQYKTIINDEGLYTDKLNLNNFTTHTIKIINDNDDVIINLDELGIKLNNKLLTDTTSGIITETDNNKIIATKKYVDDQIIHAGDVGKFYPNSTFGEYFNDYTNNIAYGDYSHAEGYNTTASGKYSHTSGYHTIADQTYMFSIGKFNKDTNNDNKLFVVGNGINNSNRNDAFVVYNNGNVYCDNTLNIKLLNFNDKLINNITYEDGGDDDKVLATKYYVDNHGGGGGSGVGEKTNEHGGERFNDYINNTGEGYYTHAEGYNTHAIGDYSHSSGYNTIANSNYMTVVGKFNKTSELEHYLFIVGNGTDNDNRSNALIVDINGNATVKNNLSSNNLNITNSANINNLTSSSLSATNANITTLTTDNFNTTNITTDSLTVDNINITNKLTSKDAIISNNLSVSNQLISNDAIISNDLAVGNDLSITKDLIVNHDISVLNDLTVGKEAIINDKLTANKLKILTDASIDNDLVVSHDISTSGDVIVGNDLSVTKDISGINAILSNDLVVNNDAEIKNDLIVYHDGEIRNDLYVTNNAIISNDLSVNNDISSKNVIITNDLVVSNDGEIRNDLYVTKNFILNNKSINDIEKMNDSTENDNKIPTLSKVNDLIATASIDLSDYDQLVKITNKNNELTAKQITLNNKLITNTTATNLEVSENDNTILATKKYVDDHQPDLSTCVKNNIDQTLINKFVFNNNSNEFTGSSLTTNNLTINNKSINDIEKANDSSVNDNKLASLAKVIDLIESGSIDLSDYSGLVKITNTDNELTAKKIILNNNEIDNIIKKNNDETSNNKSIPTYSKVEELINNIDYTDFVRKTNKQELSNEFDFTNSSNKFKGSELTLNSNTITDIVITDNPSDLDNNKLVSLSKINSILTTTLTDYIKKENQTLTNQFYFDNINNKFKGNELILDSKSITSIETTNDSSDVNNNKLASLAKINDLINNIDYTDFVRKTNKQELNNEFDFKNSNNKFKGQQFILNNNEINNIITTGNSKINDDKIYSQSKIDEINEDFVSKSTNNIQTVNGQLNLPNENNEIKMIKMYLPILN